MVVRSSLIVDWVTVLAVVGSIWMTAPCEPNEYPAREVT